MKINCAKKTVKEKEKRWKSNFLKQQMEKLLMKMENGKQAIKYTNLERNLIKQS